MSTYRECLACEDPPAVGGRYCGACAAAWQASGFDCPRWGRVLPRAAVSTRRDGTRYAWCRDCSYHAHGGPPVPGPGRPRILEDLGNGPPAGSTEYVRGLWEAVRAVGAVPAGA